jgi:radical SAM superfamily enzyme YgiQ (UPF0313 family)
MKLPHNHRRVLAVFPQYSRSFGTFHHSYPLMWGVKAFMPPQGILAVTAYLPKHWEVRFIDENIQPASAADYEWADAVFTSGMHIQRQQILDITARAHRHGKIVAAGGPSVTASPESYPDIDMLHIGELGDATDQLIAQLDQSTAIPAQQLRFETKNRLPLDQFPIPSYDLLKLDQYFIANVQFSSGCPYRCEFCDIPELYGRNPRLKKPAQVLRELDAMLISGNPGAVYFVDDNFIANRKAATELLPHLIAWQKANGYPVQFACESTLNLAQSPKLLEMMREAYFVTVFCGIETPEPPALKLMDKDHNLNMPILDAVRRLNDYGLEVVSGIIIGLDTDTAATCDRILDFIRHSNIPTLTINLLYALPKTPLWRRLEREGRLNLTPGRESNVEFLMPYDQVLDMWRRCMSVAYEPAFLFERFAHQCRHTFPNRITPPNSRARVNTANIRRGLTMAAKLFWHAGIAGSYRDSFWKLTGPRLREGKIEQALRIGVVAHHLIEFTKECSQGVESASFYSQKLQA